MKIRILFKDDQYIDNITGIDFPTENKDLFIVYYYGLDDKLNYKTFERSFEFKEVRSVHFV